MAFTALGSLGSTSSKGNAVGIVSTTSMSPSAAVAAGTIVVVWWAGDSVHSPSVGDGDPVNFRMYCTDSAGNPYVTVAGGTVSGDNQHAQTGIFITSCPFGLTTSDTISVSGQVITSGQVAPRGMSVEAFSIGAGNVWACRDVDASLVVTLGADPQAITLGSGTSGVEYLYLHGMGVEGPSTDTYTWDADYTTISFAGTTGGTDDSNITATGGYRIVTNTSDTVDVTANTPTRDYTQLLVAICEIPVPDFPSSQVPLLDNFNRANEEPLGTTLGNWDTTNCSPRSNGATTRHCRVLNNQAAPSTATPTIGGSWWNGTFSPAAGDVFQAFVTLATVGGFELAALGAGCTENATASGLCMGQETTRFYTPLGMGLLGNGGGTANVRARAQGGWNANGVKMGIQVTRVSATQTRVYYMVNLSGTWRVMFAIDGRTGSAGFSVFTGGKTGIGMTASATRMDDFYCAAFTPPPSAHLLPILGVGA